MPKEIPKKMHFACIEFSTKSGEIWRPTPEKPNFLCDPEKEIDPTSFGCWTSALNGEHIPYSFLQIGKNARSFAFKIQRRLDRIKEKMSKRPVYHNLNYLKKFNLILLIVHTYSLPLFADLAQRIQKINPHAILLGSITSPLGLLRETWKKSGEYRAFKNFADYCDLFINVNRVAQKYLEYITKTPVIYFPQFYPYEFARQSFQPRERREKTIFVAGETSRTDNLAGQLVAIALLKKHPDFQIKIVDIPGTNLAPLKIARVPFQAIPFQNWQKHLKRLASYYLVINLDQIWTLGRLQADCAAVGTPSIGINANNQMEMFPDLTIKDIEGIGDAVSLGERLIGESDFYHSVQEKANKVISQNDYDQSRQRLFDLLNHYFPE